MKKYWVLLFFLFAAGSFSCFAQTVSSQKGLTTAVFDVPGGLIKVYLPDDIQPGDLISGTITAVPYGKNEKQMGKNMSELKKYTIDFEGQKFPVTKEGTRVQYKINYSKLLQRPLNLVNNSGTNAGQVSIQCPYRAETGTSTAACAIPGHALTAAPLRITGPFDGNSSNTNCSIASQPAEILAESPRQCIIQYPSSGNGMQTVNVQETGQPKCERSVSGVNMEVSAGKLNLRRGEKTYVSVAITGLQNLPDTAVLTLNNRSSGVIVMLPSNNIVIPITKDSAGGGTFNRRVDINSIQSGSFTVDVSLDLPENRPPIFADVRVPKGGKRDEKVLTAGTRSALNIAMKKWTDANTEGNYPIDHQCENCIQCIKAYTTESNAGDVGELGWGIITSFLSGATKLAGGLLEKVKDVADKGGDIYKAIKQLIDDGKIQVIGFKEKWCDNNTNCQVTGIIVYDVATGCAEAEYRCRGNKLCCPFAETFYKMKYCFDKDGAIIDETISITINH